jgi:hypothetical protein
MIVDRVVANKDVEISRGGQLIPAGEVQIFCFRGISQGTEVMDVPVKVYPHRAEAARPTPPPGR